MLDTSLFSTLLEDHQVYHSNFQMDHFIVEKNGFTEYGMYKQSLRELYTRFEELKKSMIDFEILKHELKEEQRLIDSAGNDKRLAELKTLKKQQEVEGVEKNLEHRMRELVRFYFQAAHLKSKIGNLTSEKRDKLEKELWAYRVKKQASLEMVSHRAISVNTIENILCLPKDDRDQLFKWALKSPVEFVNWVSEESNVEHIKEYEVSEIDLKEVRRILYAANGIRDAVITRIKNTSIRELLENNETR